jgi:hypothetical protein
MYKIRNETLLLWNTYGTHRVSVIINFFIWRVRCVSEPLYALRVHLSRPPALLHRQHKQILDDYRQLARAVILSTLKPVLRIHEIKFFFAYYFLKVHLHHFSKIKSHKEVTKQ